MGLLIQHRCSDKEKQRLAQGYRFKNQHMAIPHCIIMHPQVLNKKGSKSITFIDPITGRSKTVAQTRMNEFVKDTPDFARKGIMNAVKEAKAYPDVKVEANIPPSAVPIRIPINKVPNTPKPTMSTQDKLEWGALVVGVVGLIQAMS